jgi:hypothetical protein
VSGGCDAAAASASASGGGGMSGPAKPTAGSYRMDDGRWHHTYRQSWLSDALGTCLERARRDRLGLLQRVESDAAAMGTAVHAGIEHALLEDGDLEKMVEVANAEFDRISQLPNFAWKSFEAGDVDAVRSLIATALTAWNTEVRDRLAVESVEQRFSVVVHEDAERVIELVGTIDFIGLLDDQPVIIDWKTGKRKYSSDKQASIQASVYSLAAEAMGFGRRLFKFGVLVRGATSVQMMDVPRWPAHDAWLRAQLLDMAVLLEAELPSWPRTGESSYLCNATWCPAWASCKGAHLG